MKYSLILVSLLSFSALLADEQPKQVQTQNSAAVLEQKNQELAQTKDELSKTKSQLDSLNAKAQKNAEEQLLQKNSKIYITVVGQGVAPMSTVSPAQAYALAKRAAIADGYRALAEKLKGVRVEGQDVIRNMMVQKSTIRTQVDAMIRDANIVETVFKDGLCEVELEMVLSHSDFSH